MNKKILLSVLLAVLAVVIALVMGFTNLGGWLMNDDEGTYLYDAWRVSLGDAPYRDFFLSQTPLAHYLTGALFSVLGPSVGAARVLSYLFILGAAVIIYLASRKFFGFGPNLSLTAGFVFLFTKHVYFLGRTFMPDNAMLFLSAAALYFGVKAEAVVSPKTRDMSVYLFGIFAGLAALAKLNAVLLLAGYAAFLCLTGFAKSASPALGPSPPPVRRPAAAGRLALAGRKSVIAAAGFLLTFALPYLILILSYPETYRDTIGFHMAKEKAAASLLGLVLSRLIQFVGNHNYGLVPLAVVGLLAGRVFRDPKRALLFFLMMACLAQLFLPGVFFLRYAIFAFVPLALFFQDGIQAVAAMRMKMARVFIGLLAVALVLLSLAPSFNVKKLLARDQGTRDLAAFVQEQTKPGAYVFGDDPGINFLAQRPCPPRLVDVSAAMTRSGQITADDIRTECERFQVALILVETAGPAHHLKNLRDYAAFEAYLRQSYEFVKSVPREFLRVDIYRRKTTASL